MTNIDFKKEMDKKVQEVEAIIYSFLPDEKGEHLTFIKAMNYGVRVGGKRLRPIFIIETLNLFGGQKEDANAFIAAIEFIHTYSLIHDDLPAMDDADLRRGKESVHKKFGEAMGVLAGDGLLTYAFEVVSEAAYRTDTFEKMKRYVKSIEILSKKSGINGMAGGQSVDVEKEGQPLSLDTIDFIYKLKTGALIEASMMIGAVLGGANSEQLDKIENIASDIGMAFQIMDDILDVTSTNEELGKPVNIDEKNNKTTFVTIVGVDKSKEIVKTLSNRAILNLQSFGYENVFLFELINSLIYREK